MSRVVVLGAGISGHTAALHLRRKLGKEHEVVVVSPNSKWNWIPSNIWVGVGKMDTDQVTFPLAPIYQRKGIEFHQALGVALHPQGDADISRPYVDITYTDPARAGQQGLLEYDYLINATGPKLNFAATPGLGPDGHTVSVCTPGHAVDAAAELADVLERLRAGQHQTLVVGVGRTARAPARARPSSTPSTSSTSCVRRGSASSPTSCTSPTSSTSATSASAA